MRILPISSAKSTDPSPSLVAKTDAVLVKLRAEVLSSPLPSSADEVSPESFEKQLSEALNRAGCSLLGAVIEELDERRDRLALDGSIYHCSGPSRGKIMSSFGEVQYQRSQYRRRHCDAVFPADERFGVIGGFWSPYAARLGSLSMALAPAKDCEGLFREQGGMQPSATGLNHLVETLGSAWDVVQEKALDVIRQEEGVPKKAATVAVSIDGAMLGMRKEKAAPDQGDPPRPAGFREASSGTVSLYNANGGCLRTACYGRMPESGKVSLKTVVVRYQTRFPRRSAILLPQLPPGHLHLPRFQLAREFLLNVIPVRRQPTVQRRRSGFRARMQRRLQFRIRQTRRIRRTQPRNCRSLQRTAHRAVAHSQRPRNIALRHLRFLTEPQ